MTTVLATRLTIMQDNRTPEYLFPRVVAVCKGWLKDKGQGFGVFVDTNQVKVDAPAETPGERTPRVSWSELLDPEVKAWQGTLIHPIDRVSDPTGQFDLRLEIVVRTDSHEVFLTLQNNLLSRQVRMCPPGFVMQMPGLVKELVGKFQHVYVGKTYVTETPKVLQNDHEVEGLVETIFDPGRGLPIIVVSRDNAGKTLCSPSDLAQKTVGLARVYVLPEVNVPVSNSSWILNRRFGADRSTYLGAVRIYWPGFRDTDNPYRHPLWTSGMIGALSERDTQLHDEILRHLIFASAIGVAPDTRVLSVEREMAQRRLRDAQEKVREAEERVKEAQKRATAQNGEVRESDSQERISLLEDQLHAQTQSAREYETLLEIGDEDRRHLEEEKVGLSDEIYKLRAQLQTYSARPVDTPEELEAIDKFQNARTFADLLELAQGYAPKDAIQFLDTCMDGAKKTPLDDQLDDCWLGLNTLIRAATVFHNDRSCRLQSVMEQQGATRDQFKSDVSDSAKLVYTSDYEITFTDAKGVERVASLGPHLKYGKGNKDKTPYIYWYVDQEARQFIVGHVGAKLRDGTGGYAR